MLVEQEQEQMNNAILPEKYYLRLLLPLYSTYKPEIEIKKNYKYNGVGRTDDSKLLLKIKEYFTEKYIENNYNRIRLSQIKKNYQYNSDNTNIIDYNYLKNRLKEIEDKAKSEIKRGAPRKDNEELDLALTIAYIIRFDRFVEQKECSDINEYLNIEKLTNKEFGLINDILSSFDIKLQERANSSSPIANYMRSRFKSYKKRKTDEDNTIEAHLNRLRLYYKNGTNLLHPHSYIQYKELDYDTFFIH